MLTAACLVACVGLSLGLANRPSPADAHGEPLPERAVARLGTVRWRLGAEALLVAYLPDGKSVLTVNQDLTAQVWDPASGAARLRFDASRGAGVSVTHVNGSWSPVALSADGKALAVLAADGVVRVFDPATGKERAKLDVKAEKHLAYRLALSPDGKRLAFGGYGKPAVLWDVAGGKEVGSFAAEGAVLNTLALEFPADGKLLLQAATAGNEPRTAERLVIVWDVETRKEHRRLTGLGDNFRQSLAHAAFSPDGSLLALANGNNIHLISLADGKEVRQLREEGRTAQFADCLTFTADGKHLVSLVRGQSPVVFEVATGKVVARAEMGRETPAASRNGPQRNLALSPDGKTVVFGAGLVLRAIDLASGKEGDLWAGHVTVITDLTFAADSKTVVSMDRDDVRAWNAATGQEVRRVALPKGRVTFSIGPVGLSPDGKRLAEGRGTQGWRLLDAENGKELQWFRKTGYRADTDSRLTFSPDGKTLAIFDPSLGAGYVYLIATATARLEYTLKLPGEAPRGYHVSRPGVAVFSPDGKRLAVPHLQGGVGVYETNTGKEVRSLELERWQRAGGTAFSPDGKSLAVELSDGIAAVFDLEGGKVVRTLGEKKEAAGSAARRWPLAWSPDGTLLARAEGAKVRLYDARTGKVKGELAGHIGEVRVVAFSADGKRLASGSADTTALVWDLSPFRD